MSRRNPPRSNEAVTRGDRHGVTLTFRLAYYAALFVVAGMLIGVLYLGSLVG